MSTQLEIVLSASKKLESILTSLGARGRGLHEKCSSLEHLLPADIVWSVRFVASTRNKLLHEDGFELQDLGSFQLQASSAVAYLEQVTAPEPTPDTPKVGGLTINVPNRIIEDIPLEELEWFSAQDLQFDYPPKSRADDPEEKP